MRRRWVAVGAKHNFRINFFLTASLRLSFVTSPDFMMAEAGFRVRGPKPMYATFLLLPVKRPLL